MEDKFHSYRTFFGFEIGYVSEFVYGGIDGAITTFAVVAGSTGADLELAIVVILGFANLIADGFSMSVGSYFSAKADHDYFEKHKAVEYWEIENMRHKEIEEVREIYEAKGFKGKLLQQVVDVITSDEDVWVDTMMKEELEMIKEDKTPFKQAVVTFVSFNLIGFIPLTVYVLAALSDSDRSNLFMISCLSTAAGLTIIGSLKSLVTEQNWLKGASETVLLGGLAAVIAYFVGDVLQNLL
ncbi:MAG: VIT1/CCC1 transporter family protein [Candidatus Marinimicrobia bacterium]|jgi:VIT1/CCC1 family predicted Fe2+/Mn2+ transporter|nr:hypothetical protein [Candidatus Neomarinimicrobiota bacterium]MDP6457397.1 VIT1/CCC1 transporter family protein [Candidatus Neomarinimicrobiota bacterium]MDP6593901.1 VIT1/CCC1 transporter family protein [Candidatus Neomarinimicrobiota bacterium]MDP6837077.1 VIT1/CCC1 transporter family protein [Candidatus Neomarinimicrobiota bacterium]MDP6966705.1 VIT1/CCC1 transporter family protein [Candidatus Neomarinimicrobiota bacterium]|tara:strand:+ start:421 stop:1140 length:720 start_codon:yes stop_codon:yes gene_type:complete